MGNYITSALLEERVGSTLLGQLVNITDSTAKAAAIANIIERAEGLVDGYMAKVYTVPVSANALVEEWALRAAEYELYKRSAWDEIPPKIKDSYDETIASLKDVAAGKLALPSTTATSSDSSGGLEFDSDDSLYGEDMEAF